MISLVTGLLALSAASAPVLLQPIVAAPTVVTVQLIAPPGTDLSGLDDLLAQTPGVPLDRGAVRRTLQLLDETGRFENVLAYTQPMGNGVALLVQLIPRLRITGIGFHGNSRFSDDELRQKSGLHPGDEFVRERAQAASLALVEAYQRAGYPSTQVTWDSILGTTKAQIEFQVEEGAPMRIRQVTLDGRPVLGLDLVRATLGIREGQPVDLDAIDEGIRKLNQLYRAKGRYASQVGPAAVTRLSGELADVSIPLHAGPVYRLQFHGNRAFTDRQLRDALDYKGQEAFDDALLAQLTDRLRDFYRHQGFLFGSVAARTLRSPAAVDEVFEIQEDLPCRVVRIELSGVVELDRAALEREIHDSVRVETSEPLIGIPAEAELDAIGVSGRPAVPARTAYRPDPDVYLPDNYLQALAHLTDRYREEGFLSVHVSPPQLDIDLRTREVAVQIDVREGPRTRVAKLEFTGNDQILEADLAKLSTLTIGAPLARSALERSRKAILHALAQRGLYFARVVARQTLDPTGEQATLHYDVHEGPQVHIGRVLFRGDVRTADGFIRRNLGIQTGDQYDPDALQHAQERLQQLGIFDQVQIALLEPEVAEPVKDLLVSVHERHPQSIVAGPGYSDIEGPRVSLEYTHLNLLGRAISFQAQLKLNYFPAGILALQQPTGSLVLQGLPSQQSLTGNDNFFGFGFLADAVLTAPRIFEVGPGDGVFRLEGIAEQIDRPYYSFLRAAVIPGLQLVFGRELTLGLQADAEYDRITTYWADLSAVFSRLSFSDLATLRFPPGQAALGSIGPSVSYNRLDNPINPHKGFAATLKGSFVYGTFWPSESTGEELLSGSASSNGPQTVEMFSTSGSVAGYLPVGPVVFALSLKGGRIFPIGDSFVIETQRFFLGGPDSDRGFSIDMMLPQDYRGQLHRDIALCAPSASQISCSTSAQILRSGSAPPSPGGEVFDDLRAELRFPVYGQLIDGTIFFDAGNLWENPALWNLFVLRPASGVGLRAVTPVGPVGFDVGVNLTPDTLVNESYLPQIFFSIGVL